MIPTPDWNEQSVLIGPGGDEKHGTLAELILVATWQDVSERPEYLLVSPSLGELDNDQLENLRRRPDYPEG